MVKAEEGGEGGLIHPWLRRALQETLQRQRGHAVLIQGSPGDGAFEFGLALGQGWLCEAVASGEGGRRPCGHCASCVLYASWSHPDMSWLVPEDLAVRRGMPVQLDERRKPSKQIRVDDVREAIDKAASTSGRGRGRALVIFPGEAMNPVAASALLKTLEEPAPGMRIAICAAEPARLLPTIRSRCQRVLLPRPSAEQASAWLAAMGVPDAEELLAACSGRPLEALAFHEGGISAQVWRALPRRVAEGDAAALTGFSVPLAVDALGKLCHDAMALAAGGEARFFPASAWPGTARLDRLAAWQRSLQKVQRHADHPWNEGLQIDALVAEAQDGLASSATVGP